MFFLIVIVPTQEMLPRKLISIGLLFDDDADEDEEESDVISFSSISIDVIVTPAMLLLALLLLLLLFVDDDALETPIIVNVENLLFLTEIFGHVVLWKMTNSR